jgi:hypothetical protein
MNEPARKTHAWKYRTLILAQAALAAGVLVFIFHDRVHRQQIAEALHHASPSWLVLGVLCYGLVEVLGAMRWNLLLRVQGFQLSWRRTVSIFLIGLFLMTFTPGLIGGDAARVFYVIQEAPERKGSAVLAVAMDRLIGLISLILLAALVVLLRYHWLASTAATGGLEYVTLVILAASAGLLVVSLLAAKLPWLSMLQRHPAISRRLRETGDTLKAYQRHWGLLLRALLNTLAAHILYFVTFYCAARAFGVLGGPAPAAWRGFWDMFCIMPIVNTLTALPISFAGIGIRETLFQVLLNDLCGIPGGVAAAIGSIGFGMRALWGIPGGLLLLRYRTSRAESAIRPEPAVLQR